jgi:hypothetical protein
VPRLEVPVMLVQLRMKLMELLARVQLGAMQLERM